MIIVYQLVGSNQVFLYANSNFTIYTALIRMKISGVVYLLAVLNRSCNKDVYVSVRLCSDGI